MEWINIEKEQKYPRSSERVLGIDMTQDHPYLDMVGYFGEIAPGVHDWSPYIGGTYHPTHWMRLPELPNESQ